MLTYIQRFIIVCALFCLTFNSTFPLHRDTSISNINHRIKKKASIFDHALRKIKDTTHEFGKNVYEQVNTGFKSITNKSFISGDDIRHYEQLVIMKKYPYLDIHELELKYFPSSKNFRNSDSLYMDRKMQREASLNEPGEESINVEITNRGLTGVAIPPHMSKPTIESHSIINKPVENPDNFALAKKSSNSNVLQSLTEDINAYIDNRNISVI